MKHASSALVLDYWNDRRKHRAAPERGDIDPAEIRQALGDTFMLAADFVDELRFRLAGTRVCALFGRDVKDQSFLDLFATESRHEIEEITAVVADEMLPVIAGLTATSPHGRTTHLELLLLPFNNRAHTPISLTGMLAPFETNHGTLSELTLTSWRYIHPPPQKLIPRALRKLAIARGFMVYEGLS